MKYVIVSIYDGGYGWSICDNGYQTIKNYGTKAEESPEIYKEWLSNKKFGTGAWLKQKFFDYDLIIVCEDGDVEIVKDDRIAIWSPNGYTGEECVCSKCGQYRIWNGDQYDFKYCPSCGAKMENPCGI